MDVGGRPRTDQPDPCVACLHSALASSSHQSASQSVSQSVAHGPPSRPQRRAALITNPAPGASRASQICRPSTNGGCQVHQVDGAASQRRAPRALPLDASSNPIHRHRRAMLVPSCMLVRVCCSTASQQQDSLTGQGWDHLLPNQKQGWRSIA